MSSIHVYRISITDLETDAVVNAANSGLRAGGGVCGAMLTNLSAWLSGVWFDLELVGGLFRKIAWLFPFVHGAELEKALFGGNFEAAATHILPVLLYSILTLVAAVLCFLRQMRRQ